MSSSKKGFKHHLEVLILKLLFFFIEKVEKPTSNASLYFFMKFRDIENELLISNTPQYVFHRCYIPKKLFDNIFVKFVK